MAQPFLTNEIDSDCTDGRLTHAPLKTALLAALLLLLSLTSRSQSEIRGLVRTPDSLRLPFAAVTLYADSTILQSTVSDSSGHFQITTSQPLDSYAPGHLRLRAFYQQLASELITLTPGQDNLQLIIDGTKTLTPVTIEANASSITRRGDRFVFTPSKILTKGSDAFDMLRHVPLIRMDDQSDAFAIINKSATVVYVNNRKSELPREMIVQLLRSMPAENIISIEVITNPGSEYASNITGGIININLRRNFHDGWQGSLTALSEQSKYNTSILNGGVVYRKGNVALNLIPFINSSFNYYRLNNDVTDIYGNRTNFQTGYKRQYLVLGGGVNFDYQPSSRSFFGLKYWQTGVSGHPHMNTRTSVAGPGKPDTATSSAFGGKDSYLYNFGNANFHYNLDSLGRNYLDLNIDFNRFKQDRTLTGTSELLDDDGQPAGLLDQYRNILPQRFWNLSEQIDVAKAIDPRSTLQVGAQLSHTRVENDLKYYYFFRNNYVPDGDLSQNYQYREDYQAVYANMNRNFSSKLNASVGLRFERTDYRSSARKSGLSYDSVYYNLYPSLSASYAPKQDHQFGYSLSRKIIRPDIEQLYPGRIYRSNNYFTENNPFLQPTLLFVNEVSYMYKRRYSISLTYSSTQNSSARFVIPFEDSTLKFKETILNYGTIRQLSVVFNASFTFFKGRWQLYVTPYFNHAVYSGNIGAGPVRVVNNDFNVSADNYVQLSKDRTLAAFVSFNYNGPVRDISTDRENALSSLTLTLRKTVKKFSFSIIGSDLYNGKAHTRSNLYANYLLTRNHVDRFAYTRALQLKIRYSFGNGNLTGTRNRNTANQEIRNRAN